MATFTQEMTSTLQMAATVAVEAARGNPLDSGLNTASLDEDAVTAASARLILPDAARDTLFRLAYESGLPDAFSPNGKELALYGEMPNSKAEIFLDLGRLAAYIARSAPTEDEQKSLYQKVMTSLLADFPQQVPAFLMDFVPDRFADVLSVYPRAYLNALYPAGSSPDKKGSRFTSLRSHLDMRVISGEVIANISYDAGWELPAGVSRTSKPLVFPKVLAFEINLGGVTSQTPAPVVTEVLATIPVPFDAELSADQLKEAAQQATGATALLSPTPLPRDVLSTPDENRFVSAMMGLIREMDPKLSKQSNRNLLQVDALRNGTRLVFSSTFADSVEQILKRHEIPSYNPVRQEFIWQRESDGGLSIAYNNLRAYQFETFPDEESTDKPFGLLYEIGDAIGKRDFFDIVATASTQMFTQIVTASELTRDERVLPTTPHVVTQLNVSNTGISIKYPALRYITQPGAFRAVGQFARVERQAPYAVLTVEAPAAINSANDINRFEHVSLQVNEGPDFVLDKPFFMSSLFGKTVINFYQLQLNYQGGDLYGFEKTAFQKIETVDALVTHLINIFTLKSNGYISSAAPGSIPTNLGAVLALRSTLEQMLSLLSLNTSAYASSIHYITSLLGAKTNPVSLFFGLLDAFLKDLTLEMRDNRHFSDLIERARLGGTPELATLIDALWVNRTTLSPALLNKLGALMEALPDSLLKSEPNLVMWRDFARNETKLANQLRTFFDALPAGHPLLEARSIMEQAGPHLLLGFLYVAMSDQTLSAGAADALGELSGNFGALAGKLDSETAIKHFRDCVRGFESEILGTISGMNSDDATPSLLPDTAPKAVLLKTINRVVDRLTYNIAEVRVKTKFAGSKKAEQSYAFTNLAKAYASTDRELRVKRELRLLPFDHHKMGIKLKDLKAQSPVQLAHLSAILKMVDTFGGVPCLVTLDSGRAVSAEFVGIGDSTSYALDTPIVVAPKVAAPANTVPVAAAPAATPKKGFFNFWSSSSAKPVAAPIDVPAKIETTLLESLAPKPASPGGPMARASSMLVFLFTSEEFIMLEEILAIFL